MAAVFERVPELAGDSLYEARQALYAAITAVMGAPVDSDALGLGYYVGARGETTADLVEVRMVDRAGVVERRIAATYVVRVLRSDAEGLDQADREIVIPAVEARITHALLALPAGDIPPLRQVDARLEPSGTIRFFRAGPSGGAVAAETSVTLYLSLPVTRLTGDPDA